VNFPIALMCQVLEISRSALYAWRRRRARRLARERAGGELATQIHEASRATYGSPRVHTKLRREGVRIGPTRPSPVLRSPRNQAPPTTMAKSNAMIAGQETRPTRVLITTWLQRGARTRALYSYA